MNIFTGIMLAFAMLGFADKIFSFRWGLAAVFDRGLATMGSMVIPILGVCTVGVEFIARNESAIMTASHFMPFDPSMIVGAILAPDLGGYFMAKAMAATPEILVINGVVLGTIMGQAICFQLPIFLAAVDKDDKPVMLKGFLIGITMIPAGMLAAEALLRMKFTVFLMQFIPILVICGIIALGFYKIPEAMVRGFMIVGKAIQIITNLMFAFAVLDIFLPWISFISMDNALEALLILLKSGVIISGALVLAEIVLKKFRKVIQKVATKIGTNEISVVCLLMNCATSLAILPLFDKMDEKGKRINSAFSISGAYVIGGSMAFVSAVEGGHVLLIFLAGKIVSGLLSIFIACKTDL